MKKDLVFVKRVKIIANILLVIAALIFFWVLTRKPIGSVETERACWLIVVAAGSAYILRVYVGWKKKDIWNLLSLEEKAEILATDLESGKRDWCLNQFEVGESYFFAPLNKYHLNEFGRAQHLETDREQVELLIKAGKIKNVELTELILGHFVRK